jgi:hypothetical protein
LGSVDHQRIAPTKIFLLVNRPRIRRRIGDHGSGGLNRRRGGIGGEFLQLLRTQFGARLIIIRPKVLDRRIRHDHGGRVFQQQEDRGPHGKEAEQEEKEGSHGE